MKYYEHVLKSVVAEIEYIAATGLTSTDDEKKTMFGMVAQFVTSCQSAY